MEDFMEILIYLVAFILIAIINGSKAKKNASRPNIPPTSPTFDTPEEKGEFSRQKKTKTQKRDEPITSTAGNITRPTQAATFLESKDVTVDKKPKDQPIRKIDLRKAILYSEIINRKYT